MPRTCTLVRGIVGAARWWLPWLAVLALSAGLAYATDAAITGGRLVPEAPVTMSTSAASEAGPIGPARSAFFYDDDDRTVCDRAPCRRIRRWLPITADDCAPTGRPMQYVGLNSWVPAPGVAPCADESSLDDVEMALAMV